MTIDKEGFINVTNANLVELVKAAYDLSVPAGLGFLHYKAGQLTDEEAQHFIDDSIVSPVCLDYVKGRCCKLIVFKFGDNLYIRNEWTRHSDEDLQELLKRANIKK